MPSNCLPDGVVFSPVPHVLISCICGRLCPLVPLSFLFTLSIHAFFSLHIHVSIHPWIHTAQTTHPRLPNPSQPRVPSLFCGADSHWAMLSSVMTVSSWAAPLVCLNGETACIKLFFCLKPAVQTGSWARWTVFSFRTCWVLEMCKVFFVVGRDLWRDPGCCVWTASSHKWNIVALGC